MSELVYNKEYAWQKTDALPFSPEDIITKVNPGNCGAGNPVAADPDLQKMQVERCRNYELREWYITHIANANAAPQKLRDITIQYEYEWIRSLNFAVGIFGLSALYYRII